MSAGASGPWPNPVDGAALLDALAAAFTRHLVLPPSAADGIALWVLFAHTHDAHRHSPRLAALSPTMRCGKTTLLSMLRHVVPNPASGRFSAAVLYRLISKFQKAGTVTLMLDEADTYIDGDNSEGYRGIINNGHERANAVTWRCDGDNHDPTPHSVWAPMVVAKIGDLPVTVRDRSIVIGLKRKLPSEAVAALNTTAEAHLAELGRKAASWANDNLAALKGADPAMPPALRGDDRAQDNWRPLLAIVDLAGGAWPSRARAAAALFGGASKAGGRDGVALLADIRDVFDGHAALSSGDLCVNLGSLTVVGTTVTPNIDVSILADSGYDFLLFDTQHSAWEIKQLQPSIQTMRGKPAAPLVRVAANQAYQICFALDAGARGIVVPMVNTSAEAEAAVRACRYFLLGNRSNAGVRGEWGEWGEFKNYRDYLDTVNNELVIVPMIETNQSLENLDAIASVPGVDVLLVGPSDLSIELGVPLDYQCDIYQRALDKISATAAKRGIAAAMYFIPPGMDPNFFVEKGFKFFTMPWGPWATAGIQNGLSGIKR